MAVEDDVQVFPDLLLVRSKGVIDSGADVLQRVRGVLDLARSSERDTLLIDERRVRYGSIGDLSLPVYEVAKTLPDDETASRLKRIAIIAAPGTEPLVQFAEDVFRNRGLELRYFYDEVEARDWLARPGV